MTPRQRMKQAQNNKRVKSIRKQIDDLDKKRKTLSSKYKEALSKALSGKSRKRKTSSKSRSKRRR